MAVAAVNLVLFYSRTLILRAWMVALRTNSRKLSSSKFRLAAFHRSKLGRASCCCCCCCCFNVSLFQARTIETCFTSTWFNSHLEGNHWEEATIHNNSGSLSSESLSRPVEWATIDMRAREVSALRCEFYNSSRWLGVEAATDKVFLWLILAVVEVTNLDQEGCENREREWENRQ